MFYEDETAMLFRGYFDDSGKEAEHPVVSCGGMLFRAGGYRRFDRRWQKALDDLGLSQAKNGPGYFRMSDFSANRPPYDSWGDQRNERLNALLDIIVETAHASVGAITPVESFRNHVSPSVKKHLGGAFGMAAACCFAEMAPVLRQHPEARLSSIFEEGSEGHGQVELVHSLMRRTPAFEKHTRLHDFARMPKIGTSGLQAADIVAYEIFRRAQYERGLDPSKRPPRGYVLGRLSILPHRWVYVHEDKMRDWSRWLSLDLTDARIDFERRVILWPSGRSQSLDEL